MSADGNIGWPRDSVSERPSTSGQEVGSATKTAARTVDAAGGGQVEGSAATDVYLKRLSACTFKPVTTTTAAGDAIVPARRLFRCGICYEKFGEKDLCLEHIAEQHSSVRKPVLPDTKFEAVRKAQPEAAKTAAAAAPPAQEPQVNGAAPARKTRHRKVLAIDSFYFQVGKRCTRYVCDDCGRMMMSRFAFARHMHEHKEPPAVAADEELARPKRPSAKRGGRCFCHVCGRNVPDGLRHRMFHTIARLESEFPSSASMLANMS